MSTIAEPEALYGRPPIFIVGNARSGTTLLQLMLSAHPQIYITFELSFYNWARGVGRFVSPSDFLDAFFTTGGFQWLDIPAQDILMSMPSPLEKEDLWRAYREMMVRKAASFGRTRWGDKTPGHYKHLDKIYRDFPNAKVICMARDPRSAVPSTQRMPWGSQGDLANALTYEDTFKRLSPYLGRVLLVKLEDLQGDPGREMKRILDFVEEEWDDAVLDHAGRNPDPCPVPPLPWLDSAGDKVKAQRPAPDGLTPVRIRAIEKICRKSMTGYGYVPAQLPAHAEPSKRRIRRYINSQIPDALRYVAKGVRFYLYIRKPGHWAWEDEGMHERFTAINPKCWTLYPDFFWPTRENYRRPAAAQADEAGTDKEIASSVVAEAGEIL